MIRCLLPTLLLLYTSKVSSTSLTWTSAVVIPEVANENALPNIFSFKLGVTTPLTQVGQFISIKSNVDWIYSWPFPGAPHSVAASVDAPCTVTNDNSDAVGDVAFSTGGTGDPRLRELKITLGASGQIPAGPLSITCIDNGTPKFLGPHFSAVSRTFTIVSSTDTDPLVDQVGFGVVASSATATALTWHSATMNSGYQFTIGITNEMPLGQFALIESMSTRLWQAQGVVTCSASDLGGTDFTNQINFFGTSSNDANNLNVLKITIVGDTELLAAGTVLLLICTDNFPSPSVPATGQTVFKIVSSVDTLTLASQNGWDKPILACDTVADPSDFCESGLGLKPNPGSISCGFSPCSKTQGDQLICCVPRVFCDSISDLSTPTLTEFCVNNGGNGLIDAAGSTACDAPTGCTIVNDAAKCCKPDAKCDTLTTSSTPTLAATCTGASYTGALIDAATSTYCAGLACATLDTNCCAVKAKCDTLTDSSTPTLEATCTGASYTGALIGASATTDCADVACATSDASSCCAVKAICDTVTTSSTPTLAATCTGASYTGALIDAATSTYCADVSCAESDASACCARNTAAKCDTLTASSTPTLAATCTGASYTGALIGAAATTDCADVACATSDTNCCEAKEIIIKKATTTTLQPVASSTTPSGGTVTKSSTKLSGATLTKISSWYIVATTIFVAILAATF